MPDDEKKNLRLEIAHVLFMDIVGYSKLLVDEQREALHELNQIVLNTEAVREAEAAGGLIRLPTGDGMALGFTHSMEAPVECALQISQALRALPSLPLRMGIHSGPVQHVVDVNGRGNIAGAGINIAQRVMDCGDAGHILISKRVADDLAGSRRWAPLLHNLGDCEVKHGLVVSMVNLYAEVIGNPAVPAKLAGARARGRKPVPGAAARHGLAGRWRTGAVVLALVGVMGGAVWWWLGHRGQNTRAAASAAGVQAGSGPVEASAGVPVPEKSIAVLPFENLSADKENAYFTDGVQDEILTDLAKVADLKVISRTSVMQYKGTAPHSLREIAAQLGVAHVLEGSVERGGGKVRVRAKLIDARTDTQTWAEKYDRDLADVFAIQSEIAQTITDQLRAQLSPREAAAIQERPTADLAAYDLYLRAKELFDQTGYANGSDKYLPDAVRLLDEAVARDPGFLVAFCLLARAHDDIYWGDIDRTPARLSLAEAAIEKAAALRPDAGEVHLARAVHLYHGRRDLDGALRELNQAVRTLPNSYEIYLFRGSIVRRRGLWEDATRDYEKGMALNPRGIYLLEQLNINYEFLHRYTDSARLLDALLALSPRDPDLRTARATVALRQSADLGPAYAVIPPMLDENRETAADAAEDAVQLALCGRDPDLGARALAANPDTAVQESSGRTYPHAFAVGMIANLRHDADGARAAFEQARAEMARKVADAPGNADLLSSLGVLDAMLGRRSEAIDEGERAAAMLPVASDALIGPKILTNLVIIHANLGMKPQAIDRLAAMIRLPGAPDYGLLRLEPYWDPLRGDKRFEALVASLAPKP